MDLIFFYVTMIMHFFSNFICFGQGEKMLSIIIIIMILVSAVTLINSFH